MQTLWGCQRRRLLLPVLLGGAAPEGFEAVVVAGFFGEDMHHDIEEVEADPGRPLVEALGAWTVSLLDHALYDLLGNAARLALSLGAGHHEGQRLACCREPLLPGDGLVAPHRISSFKSPPSVRLPSPL